MGAMTKKSESMSGHALSQFELTKRVLNNLKHFKLSPTTINVLWYLTSCYNPLHGYVFPKQSTIAENLGCSERSVVRAIQSLVKEGIIIVECKYTNRYKFTSRIVSETSHLSSEKMSDNAGQNDTLKRDNLSHVIHEQKKETKKEQTVKSGENVYTGDDLILYEYAKKKAKYSVDALIKKIKENGGDKKIIKEYNKKQFVLKRAAENYKESQELLKRYTEYEKNAVPASASDAWIKLGEKMKSLRG